MQNEFGNLNVISQMKEKVLKAILSNAEIVALVKNMPKDEVVVPAFDLRYHQIAPWRKVPETNEDARTYVSFDVGMSDSDSPAAREYALMVWVMVPDNLMPIDNKIGTMLGISDRGARHDILSDKIDYLLNGTTDMGFGKLQIVSSNIFEPINGYNGRYINYYVQGWNRYGEQLYERTV